MSTQKDMPIQQDESYPIPNAKWWEAHSHVIVKEDFTAKDDAWVQNQLTGFKGVGTNKIDIDTRLGNVRILTVKRMVVSGVVAVKRRSGRIKTVTLPHDVEDLLKDDLDYIYEQINAANPDMTQEEQEDFLPGANGRSEEHSVQAK